MSEITEVELDYLFRCDSCETYVSKIWLRAPNPFDPDERIHGCPNCKTAEQFTIACDNPGCNEKADCGFYTKDWVYRHTCSNHRATGER